MLKFEHVLGKGPVSGWIKNYLFNWTQFVQITHTSSKLIHVTSGVSQGSVLAPALFFIFINDLPTDISVNIRLFVDDCILYKEITSPVDHVTLNNALMTVSTQCAEWKMSLNVKKNSSFANNKKTTCTGIFLCHKR